MLIIIHEQFNDIDNAVRYLFHPASYIWIPFFGGGGGVKRPGRVAEHTSPSGAKAKNE